jgi:hypothetical protein
MISGLKISYLGKIKRNGVEKFLNNKHTLSNFIYLDRLCINNINDVPHLHVANNQGFGMTFTSSKVIFNEHGRFLDSSKFFGLKNNKPKLIQYFNYTYPTNKICINDKTKIKILLENHGINHKINLMGFIIKSNALMYLDVPKSILIQSYDSNK